MNDGIRLRSLYNSNVFHYGNVLLVMSLEFQLSERKFQHVVLRLLSFFRNERYNDMQTDLELRRVIAQNDEGYASSTDGNVTFETTSDTSQMEDLDRIEQENEDPGLDGIHESVSNGPASLNAKANSLFCLESKMNDEMKDELEIKRKQVLRKARMNTKIRSEENGCAVEDGDDLDTEMDSLGPHNDDWVIVETNEVDVKESWCDDTDSISCDRFLPVPFPPSHVNTPYI